jgi:predicted RNase H-like nuclease (RuvC/YqgF family)
VNSLEKIQDSNLQLDQAKNALDELKQVVGELQDSFNRQKIELEESIKSINSTIDTLKFKIGETITKFIKFNEIEKNIDEQGSAIEELDSSFSRYEAEFNEIKSNFREVTSNLDSLKNNYLESGDRIAKIEGEYIEYKKEINTKLSQLDGPSEYSNQITKLEDGLKKTSVDIEGLVKRIINIEKEVGITTGDLIGRSFDSVGMLRQTVSQLVGEEKTNQFVPEDSIDDPIKVIRSLKSLIRELSFMDDSNIPSTSEILLKYSEISDKSDRISLFLAYNNDIRRIIEVGQAVLMEIGQKRTQTRRILEEVKNLASKWTSEDDLTGDSGILAALELLKILEMEFQSI